MGIDRLFTATSESEQTRKNAGITRIPAFLNVARSTEKDIKVETGQQIGIKNTISLKTLDITGFFRGFQLNCYVFSLVFALISRNKGNFLYST
ncbi:MAG: hypothetical protein IKL13_03595, partial [Clostridia bacterium]|nr:hypothetical protein [Clostridia bacterium]